MYMQKVTENTGWNIVVDFKSGAGGSLGTAFVARAVPDGHTLVQASAGYTIAGAIYKKPPYDPITDLTPISLMHEQPSMMVVLANSRFNSMRDYLAYAKANPGKVNVATNGQGSISHLTFAWLHNLTGTEVTFIPYKGAGDVNVALIGGQVDMGTITITTASVQAKAGKVKILASATGQRLKAFPDIPTVSETVPGYAWSQWFGYMAPAKTPPAIVNKISGEFQKAVRDPAVTKRLTSVGNIPLASTPEQFRQLIATEAARWRKLVQDIGFTLED
jgi:tripartite-type tricarboxylate transporter receptor subunit TctC